MRDPRFHHAHGTRPDTCIRKHSLRDSCSTSMKPAPPAFVRTMHISILCDPMMGLTPTCACKYAHALPHGMGCVHASSHSCLNASWSILEHKAAAGLGRGLKQASSLQEDVWRRLAIRDLVTCMAQQSVQMIWMIGRCFTRSRSSCGSQTSSDRANVIRLHRDHARKGRTT